MVQRIRYCKTDNAENEVSEQDFRSELEIETAGALPRQQGLALLMSLQQTPQLKGHSLQVKAPLGESTIWRPLQEVRVIPATKVLDIKAVKGASVRHSYCTTYFYCFGNSINARTVTCWAALL